MKTYPIKYSIIAGLAAVACFGAVGSASATDLTNSPPYRSLSLGVDPISTMGPGGTVSWRFIDNLGLRAGINYLSFSGSDTIQNIDYQGHAQFLFAPLTLDIYPWKTSSFHICVGAVINELMLDGSASGRITVEGDHYDGSVALRIQQQPVDPYIGIRGNLCYFDREHHWALVGELGAMYAGDPRVSLSGSESNPNPYVQRQFNSDLATVDGKIKHDARYAEFWPVLTLGVSYSF